MRTPGMRRLAGVGSLVALVAFAILPSPTFATCLSEYRDCRDNADRAFINGQLGVIGHAIQVAGCENQMDFCESYCKEKENGK